MAQRPVDPFEVYPPMTIVPPGPTASAFAPWNVVPKSTKAIPSPLKLGSSRPPVPKRATANWLWLVRSRSPATTILPLGWIATSNA